MIGTENVDTTETDQGVLHSLDWEYVEPCIRVGCDRPAGHLVQVAPGPDTCLHPHWYACCSGHTVAAVGGNAKCVDCNETLIVQAVRDM